MWGTFCIRNCTRKGTLCKHPCNMRSWVYLVKIVDCYSQTCLPWSNLSLRNIFLLSEYMLGEQGRAHYASSSGQHWWSIVGHTVHKHVHNLLVSILSEILKCHVQTSLTPNWICFQEMGDHIVQKVMYKYGGKNTKLLAQTFGMIFCLYKFKLVLPTLAHDAKLFTLIESMKDLISLAHYAHGCALGWVDNAHVLALCARDLLAKIWKYYHQTSQLWSNLLHSMS